MIAMQESQNFTNLMQTNIPQIRSMWGSYITAASAAYGVDPNLMIGFVAIENPDLNPSAASGAAAYGVMQLQPATAWNYMTRQLPALSPAYANVIQRVLPGMLLAGGFTNGGWSKWKPQFTESLFDPEFNIWTAITGICQMIYDDAKDNNGAVRLDHVVVRYNAGGDKYSGAFHKYVVAAGLQNNPPIDLVNLSALPTETKAYLIKYLGVQGSVVVAIQTATA